MNESKAGRWLGGRGFYFFDTAAVLLLTTFMAAHSVPGPKLQLGPDTTVIEAPLRSDGTPDYVAALDAMMSEGVSDENNAAPLLLRVWGDNEDEQISNKLLQRLGMTREDLQSDARMVPWDQWLKDNVEPPKGFEGEAGSSYEMPGETISAADWYAMNLQIVQQVLLERGLVNPYLEGYVAAHGKSFELLEQASRRPRMYIPLMASFGDHQVLTAMLGSSNMGSTFDSANLLRGRALLGLSKSDTAAAWKDILIMLRLARHQSQSPSLIALLIAYANSGMGNQMGMDILARKQLPPRLGREVLKELQQLPPVGDLKQTLDKGERFFGLDAALGTYRGMSRIPPQYDINIILRNLNQSYDELVAIAGIDRVKEPAAYQSAVAQHEKRMLQSRARMPHVYGPVYAVGGVFGRKHASEAIGAIFSNLLIPAIYGTEESVNREQVTYKLMLTGLALSIYKAERGNYPESLDKLVPDLLSEVPVDDFSGKPLIYKLADDKTGYLLYSVGPNGQDDGGKRTFDTDEDDIVLQVPPPPPEDAAE